MTLLSPDTPSSTPLAPVHNTVKISPQKESPWCLVLQVNLELQFTKTKTGDDSLCVAGVKFPALSIVMELKQSM